MLKFQKVNSIFIITNLLLVVFNFFYPFSFYYFILLNFLWLTLTTIGSFNILWNYFLEAHNSNPACSGKKVAITFDDGPNAEFTPQILEILRKYNAKATFFCIGKNAEAHPELLKQLIAEGHTIGNHTYSHSNNFGFFGTNQVFEELKRTNQVIKKIVDKELLLYRPAYGVTNPSIASAVKKTNLQVIGWNNRSLDTVTKSADKIFDRVTNKLKSGDIILLHDTNEQTVKVLEQLLLFLQQQHYETVTVDSLLNIKAYA